MARAVVVLVIMLMLVRLGVEPLPYALALAGGIERSGVEQKRRVNVSLDNLEQRREEWSRLTADRARR
jgi:hypothetical protein